MPTEVEDDHLLVPAEGANGFDTGVHVGAREYTIFLGNWHGHVDRGGERPLRALFIAALTRKIRVVTCRRGRCAYKWWVEADGPLGWARVGAMLGVIVPVPFWRPKVLEYASNHHLADAAAEPFLEGLAARRGD